LEKSIPARLKPAMKGSSRDSVAPGINHLGYFGAPRIEKGLAGRELVDRVQEITPSRAAAGGFVLGGGTFGTDRGDRRDEEQDRCQRT
jgi:hypothetical protein